jgi:sulfopyruvate decarboxylase subunit beta
MNTFVSQPGVEPRISVRDALGVLVQNRDEATLVITNQGSARVWPLLDDHPLDFHYNPSTMGGAIPFGLGLALANRGRHVMVISGDGALTMNLGSLVTVAAARAANLTIVVLDNGLYEVTGGQKTAAGAAEVDYAALARAAGFRSTFAFCETSRWREHAPSAMAAPGPRLISLRVERTSGLDLTTSLAPIGARLTRLTEALQLKPT